MLKGPLTAAALVAVVLLLLTAGHYLGRGVEFAKAAYQAAVRADQTFMWLGEEVVPGKNRAQLIDELIQKHQQEQKQP